MKFISSYIAIICKILPCPHLINTVDTFIISHAFLKGLENPIIRVCKKLHAKHYGIWIILTIHAYLPPYHLKLIEINQCLIVGTRLEH